MTATISSKSSSSPPTSKSTAHVYSSDTTVREVIENHKELWSLLSNNNNNDNDDLTTGTTATTTATNNTNPVVVTLWDCTLYPPKNITTWATTKYPNLVGSKSLTLHNAGWYPSATLICLPTGIDPTTITTSNNNNDDPYVDVQYNTMSSLTTKTTKTTTTGTGTTTSTATGTAGPVVEFQNKGLQSTSKPSEIMTSLVLQRFDDNNNVVDSDNAAETRRKEDGPSSSTQRTMFLQHKLRQRERAQKLDQRIEALERTMLEDDDGDTNDNDNTNNSSMNKKKKMKKNQKVSKQVLRMLVKSRATGDGRLKLQDRLYFQCILLRDDDNDDGNNNDYDKGTSTTTTKEYRYFSPQDTFARISNSFQLPTSSSSSSTSSATLFSSSPSLWTEVLCRLPSSSPSSSSSSSSSSFSYRRFPVTMRIYEAIANGYLSDQIDTLIVRWYNDRDDATVLSVLDNDDDDENDEHNNDNETNGMESNTNTTMEQNQTESQQLNQIQQPMQTHAGTSDGVNNDVDMTEAQSAPINDDDNSTTDDDCFVDPALSALLQTLDDESGGGGSKKTKKKAMSSKSIAAAIKVKQMKMKSKAKGDAKRIKMEDRFFLDVVMVVGNTSVTSNFYYLARPDPIERILQYVDDDGTTLKSSTTKTPEWEFLVVAIIKNSSNNNPESEYQFKRITDPSMSLKDLETKGNIIQSFDRLILRRR